MNEYSISGFSINIVHFNNGRYAVLTRLFILTRLVFAFDVGCKLADVHQLYGESSVLQYLTE